MKFIERSGRIIECESRALTFDEKKVGTPVTPQLITRESNRRANERKNKAWQTKGNVIRPVDEKYKMDFSQLKKMVEDRNEWSINTGPV